MILLPNGDNMASEIDEFIKTAKSVLTKREEFWRRHSDKEYGELLKYLLILSIFPAIGTLLLFSVMGVAVPFFGMMRFSPFYGVQMAIYAYITSVIGPFIAGFIMSILSEALKYGGNMLKYSNLVVYSVTPFLLAQIIMFIPFLGGLIVFLGAIFSLYLLWLGLKEYMKLSSDKALILLVIYLIVIFLIRFAVRTTGYWMM